MGLLSSGDLTENLSALQVVVGDVLQNWDRSVLPDDGLELHVGTKALSRICHIGDELFNDVALPRQPGPFKRAAATAVLMRMFGQYWWTPLQGRENLAPDEEIAWRARFSLATVPVTLFLIKATLDGEDVQLSKPWEPATVHLQLEMLNFLRWLERPQVSETAIDMSRLQRTVLGMAMIIEQSYYLIGAKVDCDVMHKAQNCIAAIHQDDLLWRDLALFHDVPRDERTSGL